MSESWRWRGTLTVLLVLSVLGVLGCDDDESGGPPTEDLQPGWDLLFPGQASDPSYAPAGTAAAGLLAFASFRSTAHPDSVTPNEHIWIYDSSDSTFLQITSGGQNDFDPSWSPSGTRLAFTRDDGSRRDVFWVDITNPAAPGPAIRLTDRPFALTGATDAQWVLVDGEEQIAYSDGKDIWRLPPSGGSPAKLVPDPGDVRPADCGGLTFEDLRAVGAPSGPRMALISRGRVPLGAIHAEAFDSTGAPVTASIWINPCDTLGVEGTEAFFTGLPVGEYRVRGFREGLGMCDTVDVPVTVTGSVTGTPDTAEVDLSLRPNDGTLLIRSVVENPSDFIYFIDCEPTGVVSRPVDPRVPLDSLIFTPIECVPAGVHIVGGTHGQRVDTAWVNVVAGEEVRVTLQFMDSAYVDTALAGGPLGIYPRGGEGSLFWRRCSGDSVCIDSAGGKCIEWGCDLDGIPPAADWTEDWVLLDTLCVSSGLGDGAPRRFDGSPFKVLRARQQEGEELWIFDRDGKSFSLAGGGVIAQKPVWDPTGLNRVTYITRSGNYWGVSILNLDTGQISALQLPGQTGPFVCSRDAIGVAWSPDGDFLVVSLGPCDGGSYPGDLELWVADLTELGIP